jgi:hypothetical protein
MIDKFSTLILGQRCGPSRHHVGVSSTSSGEALYGDSRWTPSSYYSQVVLPDDGIKTGDGVSISVEKT